jgi:biopolymer transport protein ExbD
MKSHALKTLGSDNFVVILALLLATVLFTAGAGKTQQLQQGISVQMAVTSNAIPMPDADNDDAWIVAITADGGTYWGIDPLSPSNLYYDMKRHFYDAKKNQPPNRQHKLFIKADARAPFASVEKVLDAATALDLDTTVLLTSQPESAAPGTIVHPEGLEVLHSKTWSSVHTVVQVLGSEQPTLNVKLNNADTSEDGLRGSLQKLFENRREEWVVVIVGGTVPFANAAHVIDACRGTGAKVVLAAPRVL